MSVREETDLQFTQAIISPPRSPGCHFQTFAPSHSMNIFDLDDDVLQVVVSFLGHFNRFFYFRPVCKRFYSLTFSAPHPALSLSNGRYTRLNRTIKSILNDVITEKVTREEESAEFCRRLRLVLDSSPFISRLNRVHVRSLSLRVYPLNSFEIFDEYFPNLEEINIEDALLPWCVPWSEVPEREYRSGYNLAYVNDIEGALHNFKHVKRLFIKKSYISDIKLPNTLEELTVSAYRTRGDGQKLDMFPNRSTTFNLVSRIEPLTSLKKLNCNFYVPLDLLTNLTEVAVKFQRFEELEMFSSYSSAKLRKLKVATWTGGNRHGELLSVSNLSRFPNLETLIIKNIIIGANSGDTLPFAKLKSLTLQNLVPESTLTPFHSIPTLSSVSISAHSYLNNSEFNNREVDFILSNPTVTELQIGHVEENFIINLESFQKLLPTLGNLTKFRLIAKLDEQFQEDVVKDINLRVLIALNPKILTELVFSAISCFLGEEMATVGRFTNLESLELKLSNALIENSDEWFRSGLSSLPKLKKLTFVNLATESALDPENVLEVLQSLPELTDLHFEAALSGNVDGIEMSKIRFTKYPYFFKDVASGWSIEGSGEFD